MKKMLIALGALLTVSALPAAHADGYWHDGDGRAWHEAQPIHHDRHEMRRAYWKRGQDIRELREARYNGDWRTARRERMEIGYDNARIAREHAEIRHDRWDRWHADGHDWN